VLSSTELLISFFLLITLLLLSILELAFSSINKISVRRIFDSPEAKGAPLLATLVERRAEVLMSIHILLQLLLVITSVFFFAAFDRRQIPFVAGIPGTVVLMFVVILLFRHLLPRLFGTRNPETVFLRVFPLFRIPHALVRPFTRLLLSVMNYFHHWETEMEPEKVEEASEEEIQAFIDAGQEEGILESAEGEMIQSIVHFGDKVAREVMTPRTQIIAIDVKSSQDELLKLIVTKRRTRIPVFRDDLDNIEGVIHERDLLRVLPRGEKLDNLRTLVKPVSFVPETKPVDDLLNEMKENGDHLVLIVDEYGGIAGLVTMEDLIEEIVGEIHDESEGNDEKIIEESTGVYVVPGSLELSSVEEKLGMPLVEATECTTVAGAVVELFGRLPAPGEHIEHRGISIDILDADRRRVHRMRLRVLTPKSLTQS
jgi:putative hemolysin